MKAPSASGNLIAGAALPAQPAQTGGARTGGAQTGGALARDAVAAAAAARGSPQPEVALLAAMVGAGLGPPRSAERVAAAGAAAMELAALGPLRFAEQAAAAVVAAPVPSSPWAVAALSGEVPVVPVPVGAPPGWAAAGAVAAAPSSPRAVAALPGERPVAPGPVWGPPERAAAPAGRRGQVAALAGPALRWAVVAATWAWSETGARNSARMAASWIRPGRSRPPGSAAPARPCAGPVWRRG